MYIIYIVLLVYEIFFTLLHKSPNEKNEGGKRMIKLYVFVSSYVSLRDCTITCTDCYKFTIK